MSIAAKEPAAGAGDGASDLGHAQRQHTGILPCQGIEALLRGGEIAVAEPVVEGQIQPSSLDLRLGDIAYRVQASFLPGAGCAVSDKIARFTMHAVDLSRGAVLERGCVYIVPLLESLHLPDRLAAIANPKSSTGRLDVFTRLIVDGAMEFDRVPAGYRGPLYAEIAPRTFSILVHKGSRLNQLRLRRGEHGLSDGELRRLHERTPLVHAAPGEENIAGGIALTVDLEGADGRGLIGYKARQHTALIDIGRVGHYDPLEFWEPIHARHGQGLILNPDDFYILASREAVTVPPDHAAEMVAYDTLVGEFRVHYAGFFDPGFGWAEAGGAGTKAVLEVRSHDVPFLLEHGQTVGRLVYERLTDTPDRIYGRDIGSNYQQQGLALAKQFRAD
ncbi:MAG: 2'-deoxycytidine 5'-triphosphate deaminase [Alphaproteobacteria bacterium]|jgi:dCTP deaminase|nr:2'-deoxycytidine 5'-triphosphate deaminase [Alphaproteobacteria bacterium]MDP6811852.1 2'-deoxycytidine 5'-triphosphate deaminase [Alphaproteobacteria bacterium]